MAKKQHRPNLPQETLERARREMSHLDSIPVSAPTPQAGDAASLAQPVRPVQPVRTVDLRSQYVYVLTDLKNMAMLAATLLLILVVLSFFI